MFIPEYTITNKTLQNIAQIEYCKALIENTLILPGWESKLQKEARHRAIFSSLKYYGLSVDPEQLNKYLDNLTNVAQQEIKNLNGVLDFIENDLETPETDEKTIKDLHAIISLNLTAPGVYRSRKLKNTTPPEEILADMVKLMDWYNSLDAGDTHPVILAGIFKAQIEIISPFEKTNYLVSNSAARLALKLKGWELNNYYCLEEYYLKSRKNYEQSLHSVIDEEGELTAWLEYFTEGFSYELSDIREKVMLMARDTKVAKASGRAKLTERQERIVLYLQDYGILQNKDFAQIFPDLSEDSVLRDLKVLMDKGIIVKTGSTKSSRYELS